MKLFATKVKLSAGAQLPLLPSAGSLATDSSGNVIAGSGSASFAPTDMAANQVFNVPTVSQVPIMVPITGLAGAAITGDAGGVLCG